MSVFQRDLPNPSNSEDKEPRDDRSELHRRRINVKSVERIDAKMTRLYAIDARVEIENSSELKCHEARERGDAHGTLIR